MIKQGKQKNQLSLRLREPALSRLRVNSNSLDLATGAPGRVRVDGQREDLRTWDGCVAQNREADLLQRPNCWRVWETDQSTIVYPSVVGLPFNMHTHMVFNVSMLLVLQAVVSAHGSSSKDKSVSEKSSQVKLENTQIRNHLLECQAREMASSTFVPTWPTDGRKKGQCRVSSSSLVSSLLSSLSALGTLCTLLLDDMASHASGQPHC